MDTKLSRSGQFLGDEQVKGEVAAFNGVVGKESLLIGWDLEADVA